VSFLSDFEECPGVFGEVAKRGERAPKGGRVLNAANIGGVQKPRLDFRLIRSLWGLRRHGRAYGTPLRAWI